LIEGVSCFIKFTPFSLRSSANWMTNEGIHSCKWLITLLALECLTQMRYFPCRVLKVPHLGKTLHTFTTDVSHPRKITQHWIYPENSLKNTAFSIE
jgi:hypothetical protein